MLRLYGLLLLRLETAQLLSLLYQEPPRCTRLEPKAEPASSFTLQPFPFIFFRCFLSRPLGRSLKAPEIYLIRTGTNHTQAVVEAAVIREVVETVRNSAVVAEAIQGTTALHASRAGSRTRSVGRAVY